MNACMQKDILDKTERYARNKFNLRSDWSFAGFKLNKKIAEIKFESGKEISLTVKMDSELLYPGREDVPDGQGALWPDNPSDLYVGDKNGVILTPADRGERVAPCPGCDYWGDKIDPETGEPVRDGSDGHVIQGCTIRYDDDDEPCGPDNGYRDFAASNGPEEEETEPEPEDGGEVLGRVK